MPPAPNESRALRVRIFDRLLLCLLAAGLSVFYRVRVLENLPVHSEELSFVYQAAHLSEGLRARPASDLDGLMLREPLVVRTRAGWTSPFAPGHGLWLVPGFFLGFPGLMVAAAAALTVYVAYETGRRLKLPRYLLPALWLISPFFLFVQGSLLRESTGMMLSAGLLWTYLVWRQDQSLRAAACNGVLAAALLLTKPWSAFFLGVPILLDLTGRHRDIRKTWKGALLLLTGVLAGLLLTRGYNRLLTGDGGTAPLSLLANAFPVGFGPIEGQAHDHTLIRGLRLLWRYVRELDRWFLGLPRWSFFLWLALAAHGWSRRWSGLLLGSVAMLFLAFLPVAVSGQSLVGPRFQAEILPHFLLAGALGLSRIWRKLDEVPLRRAVLFLTLFGLTLYASVTFQLERVARLRYEFRSVRLWEEALESLPTPHLVFLPDRYRAELHDRDILEFNARDAESSSLRLRARAADRGSVASAFPDRPAFTLDLEDAPLLEPFTPASLTRTRSGANGHLMHSAAENDGEERISDASRHQPGYLYFGWYLYLPAGQYEARFDLRWDQVRADAPVVIEVAFDQGQQLLSRREISGGLTDTTLPFTLTELTLVEPRVHFGGSGTVRLRSIEFVRLGPPEPLSIPIPE